MQIVTFSDKRPALALSDYLRTLTIANRVEQVDDGFAVILENEADAPRALEEVRQFIAHPEDPRYRQASWESGRPQKDAVYAEPSDNGAEWWRRAGPGTRGVALVCVLVYIGLEVNFDKVVGLLSYPGAISIAAVGGTVSRCAQRKSGSPSAFGSSRAYRFPIVVDRGSPMGRRDHPAELRCDADAGVRVTERADDIGQGRAERVVPDGLDRRDRGARRRQGAHRDRVISFWMRSATGITSLRS